MAAVRVHVAAAQTLSRRAKNLSRRARRRKNRRGSRKTAAPEAPKLVPKQEKGFGFSLQLDGGKAELRALSNQAARAMALDDSDVVIAVLVELKRMAAGGMLLGVTVEEQRYVRCLCGLLQHTLLDEAQALEGALRGAFSRVRSLVEDTWAVVPEGEQGVPLKELGELGEHKVRRHGEPSLSGLLTTPADAFYPLACF